jgi:dTMP kinase
VPADKLTTANSLSLVAAYGTFPIGSLLFASLAGLSKWLGHFSALHALRVEQESLALWVDSGTFLLSAVLIFTLATPRREPHEAMAVTRSMWSEAFRDLAHGLRFIASHELVRGVMLGLGAGLFGGGAVIPLGPVYADRVLGAGSAGFGLLMTGLGFGAAAGVLALSPIQRRLPRDQLFASSVVGAGIAIVVASAMSTIIPAVLLVGVLGLCAGAAYVTGFTLIQENVTDELRGRTFATLYTVIRFCLLVSLGLAPLLAGALDSLSGALFAGKAIHVGATRIALPGVRLTLWLGGLVVVVAGGLAAADVRRARRRALGARPS